jgi:uncharacterized YccA/Bax inhibitor family protein
MPSNNPVLRRAPFSSVQPGEMAEPMTLNGVILRSFFLLVLVVAAAGTTWRFLLDHPQALSGTIIVGALGGLGCALFTTFKPRTASISGPIYSLFQGVAIGGITLYAESYYPGIAFQAFCLTFAVLFALLGLYSFRIIRVTQTLLALKNSASSARNCISIIPMALDAQNCPLP